MVVEILRPILAGAETHIATQYPSTTAHWDKIDELIPDDKTTYLSTTSETYQRDLYQLSEYSGNGTINSVRVFFCVASVAGGGLAKPALRTHNVTYDGDGVVAPPIILHIDPAYEFGFATYSQIWVINPNTSLAWTWAEVDALEAGISLAAGSDTAVYCTQLFVTVDFTPATEQTLEAASRQENLRWSFVKALYGNLSAVNQAKINYGKEKTSAANFSVWAEISDIIGARGECVRPWFIQISVYNRVQDDAYGHLRNKLVDDIKGALNAYSYSIYDFGTTDSTRQNPTPTASYFYPRIDDEGVLPELGDGVDGYYIRYRCYSVRPDMMGE